MLVLLLVRKAWARVREGASAGAGVTALLARPSIDVFPTLRYLRRRERRDSVGECGDPGVEVREPKEGEWGGVEARPWARPDWAVGLEGLFEAARSVRGPAAAAAAGVSLLETSCCCCRRCCCCCCCCWRLRLLCRWGDLGRWGSGGLARICGDSGCGAWLLGEEGAARPLPVSGVAGSLGESCCCVLGVRDSGSGTSSGRSFADGPDCATTLLLVMAAAR